MANLPTNFSTPGDYLALNFGVGSGGADAGKYYLLIIGNKSTAGTGTADTIVYGPTTTPSMSAESDVVSLSGTGSEFHRMWKRVRRVFDIAQTIGITPPPVYGIFPTESVGAAATLDFVIANVSTGAATLRFYCGDEFTDTPIGATQTVASLGAALAVSINNMTAWPITASFSVATLTVTSKNKGLRANEIRVWARVLNGTTATTITNPSSTPLAGGATADSWTTALATLLPARYYYIISPSTDTTGTTFDDLVTQVLAQSTPITGIRQNVTAGFVGTQAAGSTVAASVNTERAEIAWSQTSELTAGELAATMGATLALFETLEWSYNLRDHGLGMIRGIPTDKFWKVPAQMTQANWPTPGPSGSVETALNNGLMPIGVKPDGRTYVTWSITTRHKNGSNFDYRARSSHLRSVGDRWCDELLGEYNVRFGASTIIDDVKPGEPVPGERTVQPQQIKALIFEKIDKYANRNLKRAADIKAGVIVARDVNNVGRVNATIPLRVIDLLLQTDTTVNDVSTSP